MRNLTRPSNPGAFTIAAYIILTAAAVGVYRMNIATDYPAMAAVQAISMLICIFVSIIVYVTPRMHPYHTPAAFPVVSTVVYVSMLLVGLGILLGILSAVWGVPRLPHNSNSVSSPVLAMISIAALQWL